jgi:hypothetical protein
VPRIKEIGLDQELVLEVERDREETKCQDRGLIMAKCQQEDKSIIWAQHNKTFHLIKTQEISSVAKDKTLELAISIKGSTKTQIQCSIINLLGAINNLYRIII